MRTRHGNLHLEIQTSRKSPVGVVRSSFRDKLSGKIAHAQHGRITGCSLQQLKVLQFAFREGVLPAHSPKAFRILQSKEYGASRALLQLARQLGLHRMLYSRPQPWVQCVLAMIVGRIIYQGSKLSLCNQWANTTLWELCGIDGRPDVDLHCYLPLDRLLERQRAIQKKLAAEHLYNGCLVFYDMTSTYFEGQYKGSDVVRFGYNRDQEKEREQIVIGLLCNARGCPVGCEVFPGNTNDPTTVIGKIAEWRQSYGLEKIIFVGGRGVITDARLEELRDVEELNTISVLTHPQILKLLKDKVIQAKLFDHNNIVEVIDPNRPGERYCLCRNPLRAESERKQRYRLIELTQTGLEKIAAYKKRTTVATLGGRIVKLLEQYKVGKYFQWNIEADAEEKTSRAHKVLWSLDEKKLAEEELLDGCDIVLTDVPGARMGKGEVVAGYEASGNIERAFSSLKAVGLEVTPVYHEKDHWIKADVFLCVLALHLQWHLVERLRPLFRGDGECEERPWSVENVVERLKQICRSRVEVNGAEFHQITSFDEEQNRIIDLLQNSL